VSISGLWNTLVGGVNQGFSWGIQVLEATLFFDIGGLPLVILWLLAGALFFTLRMGFINVRGFWHAIRVVRGIYDTPDEPGEVTHEQAVSTALSATVGLGNIAGVAIAIQLGGPGAVLWMSLAGFLGMSSKFVECTLGQKYRVIHDDGTISGGPMYYLSRGLAKVGLERLGQILAALFAGFCALAALGGSNMFQANQSYAAVAYLFPELADYRSLYGLVLALLVGLVILGGIRRIGAVAGTVVPLMAGGYLISALWVICSHATAIPGAFATIWQEALHPHAIEGGILGVLVQGIRRGVFSNEAGVGTASIAHSATKTDEPVREGIVASIEPFIDTVVICNVTALVCIITGVYQQTAGEQLSGVALTAAAFGSELSWFPSLLAVAVCLFAFSTMISWSYYGERCWTYLWGQKGSLLYKLLFVLCVFIGTVTNLRSVLIFSDMMMFAMAFPNILGGVLLSGQVVADLQDYWQRLKSGKMPVAADRPSSLRPLEETADEKVHS